MNSIWVMIVATASGSWIPTLEFKTEKACIAAKDVIVEKLSEKRTPLSPKMKEPMCIKIEK